MSICLEVKNLTYSFRKESITLSGVNLSVPKSGIYGLLGPNGAGKTTLLRLVLGLIKIQKGEIRVFDKKLSNNQTKINQEIGSLIETPSIYGHLTAYENLKLLKIIYDCPNESISRTLALVGLTNSKKKVDEYSLGMKQRLGIAMSIIHSPKLLLLDEPTNGLDPGGIIELRELLLNLNTEYGTSIVVSSHLLSEVEKIVSHIGIIDKGKILFQGAIKELEITTDLDLESVVSLILETSNLSATCRLIEELNYQYTVDDQKIVINSLPKNEIPILNQKLINNNINIYNMGIKKNDLESYYVKLLKRKEIE